MEIYPGVPTICRQCGLRFAAPLGRKFCDLTCRNAYGRRGMLHLPFGDHRLNAEARRVYVVWLRDECGWTFRHIAMRLSVSASLPARMYAEWHENRRREARTFPKLSSYALALVASTGAPPP